jgi:acyl-coenzyme A synthetase/AMP-(fatty) acid ligase
VNDEVAAPNGNCTIRALQMINAHPEKLALWSVSGGSLSFERFGELSSAIQRKIEAHGLTGGDAVVVMALPSPLLFATLVALMGLGCPVVFVEPWMPSGQISSVLNLTGAKAFWGDAFGNVWRLRCRHLRSLPRIDFVRSEELAEGGELKIVQLDSNQAAIISFTSGTTGLPKGVVRSHSYLWTLHEILVKYGHDDQLEGPDLTIFPNLVLFHIGTGRGSVLVPQDWSLSALRRIHEMERELSPQSLSCGPAFLERIIGHNLYPQSLRQLHVGGALVECSLLESALRVLPRASIHQVYGGTEVEPVAIADARVSLENSRRKGYVHALNIGSPISEIRTRFDDEGILWVAGPNVCSEYLAGHADNILNKHRDAGGVLWHRTGDRILSDEEGFWFAGRSTQTFDDFLFEQKLYAKLGHTRAFLHRDLNGHGLLIADDDCDHVRASASNVTSESLPVRIGTLLRDRRHRSRIDRQGTWERSLRMQRWWTYLKERSPLVVLLLLSAGPLVSGFFLSQVHGDCAASGRSGCLRNSPSITLSLLAIFSSVIFMVLARMMDELKDFEKDKLANPLRPLPRGLVSTVEMSRAILIVFCILLLCSGGFLLAGAPFAALLLFSSAVYLWLMYKEFYFGKRLADFPLIYSFSHQLVGVPLYLFGVTLYSPDFAGASAAWLYVGINVASSLSYEFTRKLKPDAHPAAQTYRQIYGLRRAGALALLFQIIAVLLSLQGLQDGFQGTTVLLVVQLFVCLNLGVVMTGDSFHKAAEGLAALAVLVSAWMGLFVFLKF